MSQAASLRIANAKKENAHLHPAAAAQEVQVKNEQVTGETTATAVITVEGGVQHKQPPKPKNAIVVSISASTIPVEVMSNNYRF